LNISVEGLRTGVTDWDAVRGLPADKLPSLTPEQQQVAAQMGISQEDYARSALAGKWTSEKLLQKTGRFARWLEGSLRKAEAGAGIESVVLNTWDGKFEVTVRQEGSPVFFKVDENLVDSFFEGGSTAAEERLVRIIGLVFRPGAEG